MSGTDDALRLERRKVIAGVAVAALLSVGATAVVGNVAEYGKLLDAFRRADPARLPFTLVGLLFAYAGYIAAYRAVAAAVGGPLLRYRDAARVVTLSFGAYLLGSAAGALAFDFYAMRVAGAGRHEAARRSLALNTLDAGGLFLFATVAGVILLAGGAGGAPLVMAIVWVTAVPAAVAGATWFTVPARARRLARIAATPDRPPVRSPRRFADWLGAKLRQGFADTIGGVVLVRQIITHPGRYLGGVVGYPFFWLGDFVIVWIALYSFGVRLSPPRLVIAEASAWVLTLLPLPGGGSGAVEASMSFALHAVGVPLSHALSAAIVYRIVSFWLPLLPALLLVPQIKPLRHDLEQAERAERDRDAVLPPP